MIYLFYDIIFNILLFVFSANYLLDHVDGAILKDRKLFFVTIIKILHRREFDVDSFG